jgi:hypothetical protein
MMSLMVFIQWYRHNARETIRRWSDILLPSKRGK